MSYIEQMFVGTEKPIAEITGISWVALPEPDDLDEQNKETLATALTQLLDLHHFRLDFPDSYPVALRYGTIRDFWMSDQVPLTYGMQTIELCTMDPDDCPFPGYCNICDEVAAQMEADNSNAQGMDELDWDAGGFLPTQDELEQWEQNNPIEERSPQFWWGFYDDDGNQVDPGLLKVPGLCLVCRLYQTDDNEENLLCTMNRYDQRNKDHFECAAFIPLHSTDND